MGGVTLPDAVVMAPQEGDEALDAFDYMDNMSRHITRLSIVSQQLARQNFAPGPQVAKSAIEAGEHLPGEVVEEKLLGDDNRTEMEEMFVACCRPNHLCDLQLLEMLGESGESRLLEDYDRFVNYFLHKNMLMERQNGFGKTKTATCGQDDDILKDISKRHGIADAQDNNPKKVEGGAKKVVRHLDTVDSHASSPTSVSCAGSLIAGASSGQRHPWRRSVFSSQDGDGADVSPASPSSPASVSSGKRKSLVAAARSQLVPGHSEAMAGETLAGSGGKTPLGRMLRRQKVSDAKMSGCCFDSSQSVSSSCDEGHHYEGGVPKRISFGFSLHSSGQEDLTPVMESRDVGSSLDVPGSRSETSPPASPAPEQRHSRRTCLEAPLGARGVSAVGIPTSPHSPRVPSTAAPKKLPQRARRSQPRS